jgi:uncharacterized membrane protein YhaH (DUF805 family)
MALGDLVYGRTTRSTYRIASAIVLVAVLVAIGYSDLEFGKTYPLSDGWSAVGALCVAALWILLWLLTWRRFNDAGEDTRFLWCFLFGSAALIPIIIGWMKPRIEDRF